ncbi:hypothetical protein RvY_08436 [Ramazzottius varieornatus]|uniref:alpha-1,2-Mannosidase n=1 Tax=Ramazzottius varieornatus TaxID=947166 RepID=A0A1D1VBF2_RAMVA|nr:hypothetical protein RvY_08436 [Ramazzottius varieornatus]
MMKYAWDGYVQYAWGDNELRPTTKRGFNPPTVGTKASGATIIDAADTLYIMGLKSEFERARTWIASSFNISSFVAKIIQHLYNLTKPAGLYSNYLDSMSGKWGSKYVSLGAYGDSFYEYLFKMWLWGGKTDKRLKEMFDSALVAVEKHTMKTSKAGLLYFTRFPNGALDQMEHLACFAGGMYALSAPHAAQPERSMEVARNVTTTCHESYARTGESALCLFYVWFNI